MIATALRLPLYALLALIYVLGMYCTFLALHRRQSLKHWEERNARTEAMHARDREEGT